jgi:hypothetical protein
MARLNRRVSVYWLWLAIVFGVISLIPWYPGRTGYLPVATAYANPGWRDWQPTLLGHVLLTLLIATPLAIAHTVILSLRGRPEPVTFSLRGLLLATGAVALILGGLRWCNAAPVVFAAVIILLSGYPATVILGGLLARRITWGQAGSVTEPPPDTACHVRLMPVALLSGGLPIWLFLIVTVPQSPDMGGIPIKFVVAPLVLIGTTVAVRTLLGRYRDAWALSVLLAAVTALILLSIVASLSR